MVAARDALEAVDDDDSDDEDEIGAAIVVSRFRAAAWTRSCSCLICCRRWRKEKKKMHGK